MFHPDQRYLSMICDSAIVWRSWDGVKETQVSHQLVHMSVSSRMNCGIVKLLRRFMPISELLAEELDCFII